MLQEIGITAIIGCNYFCNALYNLLIAKDKIQRTYAQKVIIIIINWIIFLRNA